MGQQEKKKMNFFVVRGWLLYHHDSLVKPSSININIQSYVLLIAETFNLILDWRRYGTPTLFISNFDI